MNFFLDYIGAIVVGSIIVLALVGFYLTLGETATSHNAVAIVDRNMNSVTEILEYDMRRAGYRVADSIKITRADSSRIIFRADIDDNGTVDSITFALGNSKSPNSANPRARTLFRTINNQQPRSVDAGITRFRLRYYDGSGAVTTNLSKIRSIGVWVAMQTTLENDSVRAGVVWEKVIKPMNLR